MQPGRGGAEALASLLPVLFGAALVIAGVVSGSRRDVLIGVALVCTGIVGLVAPRLVSVPSGFSPERARARRGAAVMLPNGVIYLALGILLRTAIPTSERGGTTLLITIFAIGMGILSILSGLGALVRARRADDSPAPAPLDPHADDARHRTT